MTKYPTYCSIAETNDSIAGSIVAVETHGRASLQYDTGRAFPQHDTNNPTNDNPLECDNVNFFQL